MPKQVQVHIETTKLEYQRTLDPVVQQTATPVPEHENAAKRLK